MNDEFFMRRCLELAAKAEGQTYPNPLVGSVIVHEGKIIGEGYHRKSGEAHAEIHAINAVENQALLQDSTIYVSLEPCAHYGKTPPCALKIVEKQFKKVVVAAHDHHEKVNGKGAAMIREAGIEIVTGVLEKEAREQNRRFFTFHEEKRPYIILKWAQSADGFIDKEFKPYPISNDLVNQFMHTMRAQEHAILVGSQTALNDNPSLTVRHVSGRNPVRILIDRNLKTSMSSALFDHSAPTIILNAIKSEAKGNLKFIKTEDWSVRNILKELHENDIQSVIVEGGRFTLEQFIKADLWDEAVVIKNGGLNMRQGTNAPLLDKFPFETVPFRNNFVEFYKNYV